VRQPETSANCCFESQNEQQQTDSDCSRQHDIERYIAEMAMTQSSTTLCAPLCVGLSRGMRYQQLSSAQQQYPQLQQRSQDLIQLLQTRLAERQAIAAQMKV